MIRTEIYANRSIEQDILEAIVRRIPDVHYSLIEDVQGRGKSGIRHGTAIWPELNVLYILYANAESARLIREAVEEVKTAFPKEGIKIYQYRVDIL